MYDIESHVYHTKNSYSNNNKNFNSREIKIIKNSSIYSKPKFHKTTFGENVKSKIRKKFKSISRSLLFFVFFAIFIFQSSNLTQSYLNFNTIVNTKIEKIKFSQLPAITVCYPSLISLEKIERECQYLMDLFVKLFDLKPQLINSTDPNNPTWDFVTYHETLRQLIKQIIESPEVCEKDIYKKSVLDLFESYGILFEMNDHKKRTLVDAKAFGRIYVNGQNITYTHIEDMTPIESITATEEGSPKKCFTFFSKFNAKSNDFVMDLSSFEIEIRLNNSFIFSNRRISYPVESQDYGVYFSMHSSLSTPPLTSDNYLKLTLYTEYHLSYSRIVTQLLPSPYASNCRKYDNMDIKNDQTKSDCIDRCLTKYMLESCGDCLQRIGILYRFEAIDIKKKFCENISHSEPCLRRLYSEVKPECEARCQNDCEEQFFEYRIESDRAIPNPEQSTHFMDFDTNRQRELWIEYYLLKNIIKIYHKSLPDTLIQHIPEMTLTAYIAQLGGLAGMWLGLSAMALYDYLVKFIINLYQKFKT